MTLTDDELRAQWERLGSIRAIARETGVPRSTVQDRVRRLGLAKDRQLKDFEIVAPADPEEPVEDLIGKLCKQYERKAKHEQERALIPIHINIDGPIGIVHFGDPHLDDDGTNWPELLEHIKLVQDTEGMFATNVGDSTNCWVGRLAKLYGEQTVTAKQAWRLVEWFFGQLQNKLLYTIAGNHDMWAGSGDPIEWIAKQHDSMYQSSECRIALHFPNGVEVRINARHDFSGNSIYNPAHGAMKAAQFGARDHINVCGHKHASGYGVLKCPMSGIHMHCIQVASYKRYDRYAREKGFRDQHLAPCAVTIIDPYSKTQEGMIQVFHDVAKAARFLTMLRQG